MNEEQQPKGLDEQFDETFEFDGSEVEDGFELVEEGRHPAMIVDIFKETSQSGNPMYVWDFLVIGGPEEGKEIRDWTSLLPQARWKVADYLRVCGIDAYGKTVDFKRSDIVGTPVYIDVSHGKNRDGKTTDNVDEVHEADKDLKQLAEAYKSGGDIPEDFDTPF